jgi:hypothetical protein
MINSASYVAVAVVAVLTGTALVWWAVRVTRETHGISKEMKAAAGHLNDFFEDEAAKYELMALYSAGPDADVLHRVEHINDSAADWANLLFARYAGPSAELAYDQECATWVASVPLFDGGPLVGFSVDTVEAKRPLAALLGAVELVVDDGPPVIDSAERPSQVCVRYEEEASQWKVYQPCEDCGGGWLSTHFADPSFASLARWTAHEFLVAAAPGEDAGSDERPVCAQCLAREMREAARICDQPTCWYDTLTGQWMLSESLGEDTGAVCVPLGIETFFVNHGVVLAAANQQLRI